MVHFYLRNSKLMVLESLIDWTETIGGILLFERKNLMTRLLLRHSFYHYIEIILIKLNLRNKKWLIYSCHNPHKNLLNYDLQELAKGI